MQNLIKIYHVVQEIFAFSLTGSGWTDGLTHCGSCNLYLKQQFYQLQANQSVRTIILLYGCSLTVTSSKQGGFVVMWFYVLGALEGSTGSGFGLKRLGRWDHSLRSYTGEKTFCGFSWAVTSTRAGGFGVCVIFCREHWKAQWTVALEKLRIESTTPKCKPFGLSTIIRRLPTKEKTNFLQFFPLAVTRDRTCDPWSTRHVVIHYTMAEPRFKCRTLGTRRRVF